jgi:hypothetical protein
LADGLILADNIEVFNKNITNILESEKVDENCIISSLKFYNNDNNEQ